MPTAVGRILVLVFAPKWPSSGGFNCKLMSPVYRDRRKTLLNKRIVNIMCVNSQGYILVGLVSEHIAEGLYVTTVQLVFRVSTVLVTQNNGSSCNTFSSTCIFITFSTWESTSRSERVQVFNVCPFSSFVEKKISGNHYFFRFLRTEIFAPEKLPGNISIASAVGLFVGGIIAIRTWGDLMVPA